jgi:molybdopterin-guanine dinucleotide biosynthesis protein A
MLFGSTAFILAGGKSSRMGKDKALLRYRGECLIRYPIRLLQQVSPEVRIIGDPSRYARFGLPVSADCVPSRGPLSGIYTGLKSSSTRYNLFLACDMPLVRPEFFELLFSKSGNGDAVVMRFEDGFVEPLCSIYSVGCLPAIEANFAAGMFKISDFFSRVAVAYVSEKELQQQGLSREIFTNVNTPKEFGLLRRQGL